MKSLKSKQVDIWSIGVNVPKPKSLTHRFKRARKFEEHTQKYLERKYGKKHVHPQKVSRTTKKRPDFVVE
jgi:hypothetical protein